MCVMYEGYACVYICTCVFIIFVCVCAHMVVCLYTHIDSLINTINIHIHIHSYTIYK